MDDDESNAQRVGQLERSDDELCACDTTRLRRRVGRTVAKVALLGREQLSLSDMGARPIHRLAAFWQDALRTAGFGDTSASGASGGDSAATKKTLGLMCTRNASKLFGWEDQPCRWYCDGLGRALAGQHSWWASAQKRQFWRSAELSL